MRKKLLSLLVATGMMMSVVPTAALAADSDEEQKAIKLTEPEQVVEVIQETEKDGKLSKSEYKEEVMRRVVFQGGKPKNTYGAEKLYYYTDGHYYIVEYKTDDKAREAVKKMKKDNPDAVIFQDVVVKQESVKKETYVAEDSQTDTENQETDSDEEKQDNETNMNTQGTISAEDASGDENAEEPEEPVNDPDKLDRINGAKIMGLDKLKKNAKDWEGQVKVAVIDSGINKNHPWFKNRVDWENSKNFAVDNTDPKKYDDVGGHGTHVSGIITQSTPDQVQILTIRVFNFMGSSSLITIAEGIDYAYQQGAKVINMSLGQINPTPDQQIYVNRFLAKCVNNKQVLMAASGNEYRDTSASFPACSAWTMAIGSMEPPHTKTKIVEGIEMPDYGGIYGASYTGNYDELGAFVKSDFSNNGKLLDFVAPGQYINSAYIKNGQGYPDDHPFQAISSGTSMATPYAAAAAAMVTLKHPEYNQWDVYASFQDNAEDLLTPGKDDDTGYGYVDMSRYDTKECKAAKPHQAIVTQAELYDDMSDTDRTTTLKATLSKGNGPITYTSSDSSVIKIKGDQATTVGAGECEITVTAGETEDFAKTERRIKVRVERGVQKFQIKKYSYTKKKGDKPFYLKASVKKPANGKVTFVTNENNVVDVSEKGKVTIKGTGTALVYAQASSTKNYKSATSEPIAIKVLPKQKASKATAKAFRGKKVRLSWSKVASAKGYAIQFSKKKSGFKTLKKVKGTGIVLKSNKLKVGKSYYFAIKPYHIKNGKPVYSKAMITNKIKIRK